MTRINPNDPKWTAYVLGELDKADSEAVERLLKSSPEARALVDELTAASAALTEALDEAPADVLTAAQRASVRQAADAQRSRWQVPDWLAMLPMRWAVSAASLVVVAIAVAVVMRAPQPAREIALTPAGPPPSAVPNHAAPIAPVPSAVPPSAATTPPQDRIVQAPVDPPAQAHIQVAGALGESETGGASVNAAPAQGTPPNGALAESIAVTAPAPPVDVQSARQLNSLLTLTPQPPQAAPAPPVGAPGGRGGRAGGGGGGGRGAAGGPNQGRVMVDGQMINAGGAAGVRAGVSDSVSRIGPRTANESYARTDENPFVRASEEPLATFSIDVDTASFSNVRRFLNQNQMPPRDAVRIEELINYFTYDYPNPSGGRPIGVSMAVTTAPWNTRNRLVRFGVKAREIDRGRRPASNLVFLIDVSGSMNTPQKLPLVKSGLKLLVDQLGENDTVSIVVYASATGLVLPPTRGDRKDIIARALDDLQAGGSTNGGAGIQLAYAQATGNFIRGGVNRVILMTDGDFNVGITSQSDLTRLIEDRAKSGVFLSVLGFGMGNLKDSTMERLADMGNGHYAYIDTLSEARKVLVEEMSGTLVTVAKDVKIQVDFNPAKVEAYRLIGYENRILRTEDFNNDLKDAGDMGAGHTVTALFEIVPRGGTVPGPSIDPSVFQPAARSAPPATPTGNATSNDLLVLRLRYKLPDAAESTRMDVPLADRDVAFARAPADVRFAAAVAAFGMILKESSYKGDATLAWVLDTASGSAGQDRGGYRDEFVSLVRKAIALSDRQTFVR
jgi:Ca-activated chloride channel family protein